MRNAAFVHFERLSFEKKIELVAHAKTRVTRRGSHGLSMLSEIELVALTWFADLWLDDHEAIPLLVRSDDTNEADIAGTTL